MAATIGLRWRRDSAGYDIVQHSDGNSAAQPFIIARGGESDQYRIDGTENRLFEEFANTPLTDAGVIDFTNRWGYLMKVPPSQQHIGIPLGTIYGHINGVRAVLKLAEAKEFRKIAEMKPSGPANGFGQLSVDVELRPNSDLPHVLLRPVSLISFIYLEAMQSITPVSEIRRCQHCSKFFTIGPETGRNSNRVFCRNACKLASHRARKRIE